MKCLACTFGALTPAASDLMGRPSQTLAVAGLGHLAHRDLKGA